MGVLSAISTAASSLLANARAVSVGAGNVVNALTPAYRAAEVHFSSVGPGGESGIAAIVRQPVRLSAAHLEIGNTVDIANEFARMMQAETAYKASAALIRTGADMMRTASRMVG